MCRESKHGTVYSSPVKPAEITHALYNTQRMVEETSPSLKLNELSQYLCKYPFSEVKLDLWGEKKNLEIILFGIFIVCVFIIFQNIPDVTQ